MKFGATGDFPQGQLNEDDEGGIAIGIAYDPTKNVVLINFGKPVVWLGMGPDEAVQFANMILAKAKRS